MGGLERKGVHRHRQRRSHPPGVAGVLAEGPERFILAADCTVPGETPWENLKTAIDTAHQYRKYQTA